MKIMTAKRVKVLRIQTKNRKTQRANQSNKTEGKRKSRLRILVFIMRVKTTVMILVKAVLIVKEKYLKVMLARACMNLKKNWKRQMTNIHFYCDAP